MKYTTNQQFILLADWIENQVIPTACCNYNCYFRDILSLTAEQRSKQDSHYNLVMNVPLTDLPLNHGHGELREEDGEREFMDIQIRKFPMGVKIKPIKFEEYVKQFPKYRTVSRFEKLVI